MYTQPNTQNYSKIPHTTFVSEITKDIKNRHTTKNKSGIQLKYQINNQIGRENINELSGL